MKLAQELLEGSVLAGSVRYAVWNGGAFCAHEHWPPGCWHGYPVSWMEVPPVVREGWVRTSMVTRAQIRQAKRLARRNR